MKLNRKSLLGLLALGFLLSCTQSPEQIVEKVKNATVHVTRDLTDPPKGGSGFFIGPDQIVTNIHVVVGPEDVYVTDIVGTMYHVEGVIGSDPKYDLVILKVSGKGTPLSRSDSRIDEPIFVAGYPLGGEYKITGGTVHGIRNSDKYIRLKCRFLHGNSGGPVVNIAGRVIGVAVSIPHQFGSDLAFYSYAAPSNALKALLTGPVQPLSEWRDENPIRAHWYTQLGEEKDDDGEAIKEFDKAINLYGDFARAYFVRGEAKRNLGQSEANGGNTEKAEDYYNAAIMDYGEAIKRNLDHADSYFARGTTKLHLSELESDKGNAEKARDHYDTAVGNYDEVIKRHPDHTESYFVRGITKSRLGELESDGGNAEKARDHYNAAVMDYDEVIKRNPDYVDTYFNRGVARFRLGELESDGGNAEKARDHYNAAVVNYDEVIKRNPDRAESYLARGAAKLHLSGLEADKGNAEKAWRLGNEAVESCKKAIELNPDRRDNYIDELIVFLDRSIKLNPDFAGFYYFRGTAKKARERQQEAEADFEKARDCYNFAIMNYSKAINLDKTGKAEAYFNRGLEKSHFSLIELSLIKADGGNGEKAWRLYNEAVEDWNKAIELSPDRSTYYIDKVIVFLDRAIKFYPDSARFYYSRGLMKKAKGKQKEAGDDFEKSKALDPNMGR